MLTILIVIAAEKATGAPYVSQRSDTPDVLEEAWGEDDEGPLQVVAVTSDGWAFVPHGKDVQLIPAGDPDEPELGSATPGQIPLSDLDASSEGPRAGGRPTPAMQAAGHLAPGDLIGARVKRGAPGVDSWRLEALGRDRDYRAWPFETEDAARAALALLSERIVRPPRDDDGEPAPPKAEDFELARAEHQQTEEELANMPEDEPPGQER